MSKYDLCEGLEIWSQCGGYSLEVISDVYEKDGNEFFKAKDSEGNIKEIDVDFLCEYSNF